MRLQRTLAVATAVALALVACNGDDGAEDPVTEDITGQPSEDDPDDPPEDEPDEVDDPTEPEDPTEPDADPTVDDNASDEDDGDNGNDPEDFAVPDEIDEEYVQRVMDELMRRDSDLVRGLLDMDREASFREEEQGQIDALFGGPIYTGVLRSYSSYLVSEEARSVHLDPEDFGDRPFEVMQIHTADSSCITALGWWDVTETAVEPYSEDFHLAFTLKRDDSVDESLNPTGWQIWDNTDLRRGDGENVPQSEWSDIEFSENFDHECEQAP